MFGKKFTGLVAGMALAFGASSALAQLPAQDALLGGSNELSDDSGQALLGLSADPNPAIVVGTQVVGILGITSFPTSGANVNDHNELTALFALEVTSIVGSGSCLSFGIGGAAGSSCVSVTFGPAADFNASVGAIGAPAQTLLGGGALPADTMALVYEDPAQNFTRSDGASVPTTVATAVDGMQRMTLVEGSTFNGVLPATLADIALFTTAGQQIGSFGGNLSILEESFPNRDFEPTVQVVGAYRLPGSGSVWSGIGVHDDATFTVDVILVSEPGLLGMMGLGLVGVGLVGRLRRRNRNC